MSNSSRGVAARRRRFGLLATFLVTFAWVLTLGVMAPRPAAAAPGGVTPADFAAVCNDYLATQQGIFGAKAGDLTGDQEFVRQGHQKSFQQECREFLQSGNASGSYVPETMSDLCYVGSAATPTSLIRGGNAIGPQYIDVNLSPAGTAACSKVCDVSLGGFGEVDCNKAPALGVGEVPDGFLTPTEAKQLCDDFLAEPQKYWFSLGGEVDRNSQILKGHTLSMSDECRNGDYNSELMTVLCRQVSNSISEVPQENNAGGSFEYFVRESPGSVEACERICTDLAVITNCTATVQIGNGSGIAAFTPPEPGINVDNINELRGGLVYYALAAAVVGICVSAALWAMGSKGQNPGTELAGKKGMIVCVSAAFLIGATPAWINYLDDIAERDDPNGVTATELPILHNGPSGSSPAPVPANVVP